MAQMPPEALASRPHAAADHPRDELAEFLAHYAASAPLDLEPDTADAARKALFDSIAVAMAALRHPAAVAVRRYAYRLSGGHGRCTLWGTDRRVTAEVAALANGVLLRCHDYNDLFIGAKNWGHPSDMVAGIVAVAEEAGAPGDRALAAIALAYEIALALFDGVSTGPGGWDYSNLTSIAATCAIGRLMGLPADGIREALSIAVVSHMASDEIESGELNRRGDLTMWKRFNAGDAMRQSVYACALAAAGVEGAVRPFEGKLGFLRKLGAGGEVLAALKERLNADAPLRRVRESSMKRWPVGSRGQSAIQSAIDARAKLERMRPGALADIDEIHVSTDSDVYNHLVHVRQDPWHPFSRETADHSLPYIVAAAVQDGRIGTDSFSPPVVLDPARQAMVQRVRIRPDLNPGTTDAATLAALGYLSRVVIVLADGTAVAGRAEPAPGHPRNPLTRADLEAKLREGGEARLGAEGVDRLAACLWSVDRCASLREMTDRLHASEQDIDDGVEE